MCARSVICALLLVFQLLGGLPWLYQSASGQTRPGGRGRRPLPASQSGDSMKGLQFRLSEGAAVSDAQPPRATTPFEKLGEDDTQRLLSRLQPIKSDATDEQDFRIRDRSLPAPRTGKTIDAAFPPPDTATSPVSTATGPLEVVRFSPEGDVPLAPQLSVTFSQPMVAVTSHADSVAQGVPVRLTPQPEGRWRWVGTKTLLFETDTRLPMATEFRVEVPAGTKSATGAALADARVWKFSTPPPQVKSSYPNSGPHGRNPLIFVEFDQRIDREAVLESIRVSAGGRSHRIRLATDEEIASDRAVSRLASAAESGRWLAFRVLDQVNPETPLPTATNVTVSIGPGTPSAEGPRKTASAQSFDFFTYGPLRVTGHHCGYNDQCSPFDQWRIEFSNPLDAEAFEPSYVRVEPEIGGMKAAVYGNMLVITGLKRGRATYRVKLDPNIRDQFGQTLGDSPQLAFNVKSAPPALASSGGQFVVLDPAAQPSYSVFSINHSSVKLRLYAVGPEHWGQFAEYMQKREDQPRQPPGRLVVSKTINVESQPDEMVETRIYLSPALNANLGHVLIIVEPTVQPRNRWERRAIKAWVQVTGIGLDAFVDNTDLIGWATSLKDGSPIDGVQMTVGVAQPGGFKQESTGASRSDGLARLALTTRAAQGQNVLVARKGNDLAILPEHTYWWSTGGNWHKKPAADWLSWYVFDDRKMYRPGEEVHIKGWIRRMGAGKEGDVGPLGNAATGVAYKLKDSRGNEILKGNAAINALG
ncbi:MAG TPA: Ig-like domain-containing protein, partial [Blastocatellia bacterium]|nr:Ig-like domain-containing protein [Blastocatellia bacterium]